MDLAVSTWNDDDAPYLQVEHRSRLTTHDSSFDRDEVVDEHQEDHRAPTWKNASCIDDVTLAAVRPPQAPTWQCSFVVPNVGAFVPDDDCCCDGAVLHHHESSFGVLVACLQSLHKENWSNCSFVVDDDDLQMFDSHPCSLEENWTCYSCDVVAVLLDHQCFPFDYDAGDATMIANYSLIRQ